MKSPKVLTKKKTYSCNYCQKAFYRMGWLLKHYEVSHSKNSSEVNANKQIAEQTALTENTGIVNGQKSGTIKNHFSKLFICNKCGTEYTQSSSLSRHLRTHHSRDNPLKKPDKDFETKNISKSINQSPEDQSKNNCKCEFCEESFENFEKLQQHKKNPCSHSSDKRNQIEIEKPVAEENSLEKNVEVCQNKFAGNNAKTSSNEKHVCGYCQMVFFIFNDFQYHIQIHTGEKLFSCNQCHKSFYHLKALTAHKNTHLKTKVIKPKQAKKKSDFSSLFSNLKSFKNNSSKLFNCDICEKRTKTMAHLQVHYRSHTGEKLFNCNICNKDFRVKSQLHNHSVKFHTVAIIQECDECKKSFETLKDLELHKKVHADDAKKDYDGRKKSYSTFKNFENSDQNSKKTSPTLQTPTEVQEKVDRPFSCNDCKKSYTSQKVLNDHKRKKHLVSNSPCSIKKKIFDCTLCRKNFLSDSLLNVHKKEHEDKMKDSSVPKRAVQINEKTLEADKYVCHECGQSFDFRCRLRIHLKKHKIKENNLEKASVHVKKDRRRKDQPEKETVCDKNPCQDVNVNNILPYKCAYCDTLFSRFDFLMSHVKGHIGELTFNCGLCGKFFAHENFLKAHLLRHKYTTYSCFRCAKIFFNKNKLNIHERAHFKHLLPNDKDIRVELNIVPEIEAIVHNYISNKIMPCIKSEKEDPMDHDSDYFSSPSDSSEIDIKIEPILD